MNFSSNLKIYLDFFWDIKNEAFNSKFLSKNCEKRLLEKYKFNPLLVYRILYLHQIEGYTLLKNYE